MNVFNRVVTTILFVMLMVVVPVLMILPSQIAGFLQQYLSAVSSGLNLFHRAILVLLGILVFMICGLVLYLEFRRPARKRVKLLSAAGGEVELAVESIAQRLEYRVDQLPDVVKVKPEIRPRRASVDVVLNLETSPDIDVPAKTEEVYQAAREVVEGRMGLKLGKIKVNVKHAPYPSGV
jgi:hypothetical protein